MKLNYPSLVIVLVNPPTSQFYMKIATTLELQCSVRYSVSYSAQTRNKKVTHEEREARLSILTFGLLCLIHLDTCAQQFVAAALCLQVQSYHLTLLWFCITHTPACHKLSKCS